MSDPDLTPSPTGLAARTAAAMASLLALSAAASAGCDPWQPNVEVTPPPAPPYTAVPTAPQPPPYYVQPLPAPAPYPYTTPVPVPVPGPVVPVPVPGPVVPPPLVPVPQFGGPVPFPVPGSPVGGPLPVPGVGAPVYDPALNVGQCHQIQAWGPFVVPRVFKGSLPSDIAPTGGSIQNGVYILVEARAYGPEAGRLQAPPLRSAKRITGDVMEEWFEVQGGPPSVYTDRFVNLKNSWTWSTQCPVQQAGARGTHRYTAQGDLLVFYKVDPQIPNLEQVFFYRRAF